MVSKKVLLKTNSVQTTVALNALLKAGSTVALNALLRAPLKAALNASLKAPLKAASKDLNLVPKMDARLMKVQH